MQSGMGNPGTSVPGFFSSPKYSNSPKCNPKLLAVKLLTKSDPKIVFLVKKRSVYVVF